MQNDGEMSSKPAPKPAADEGSGRGRSPSRRNASRANTGTSKSPARNAKSSTRAAKSPSRTSKKSTSKSPRKRSPVRTRRTSISRSPARQKTPEVAGASVSPGRRSPGRKSPGRSRKLSTASKDKDAEPAVTIDSEEEDDVTLNKVSNLIRSEKSKSNDIEPVRLFENFREASATKEVANAITLRRVTRSSTREYERVYHHKSFSTLSNRVLGEFSDEDEITKQEKYDIPEVKRVKEYGGPVGTTLLILLLPLSVIGVSVACAHNCSFTRVPDLRKLATVSAWFDLKVALVYVAYIILLALLNAVPVGFRTRQSLPDKSGRSFYYSRNGLFVLLSVSAIISGLHYQGLHPLKFIAGNFFRFQIVALVFGLLLSVLLFVRGAFLPKDEWNSDAVKRSFPYAFFVGREVNVRVFGLIDLKQFLLRLSSVSGILLNAAYLYKGVEVISETFNGKNEVTDVVYDLQPTLLVLFAISTLYQLDVLLCETSWFSSAKFRYHGLGYGLIQGSVVYTFLMANVLRQAVIARVRLNVYVLAAVLVVFAVGYVMYRVANNQKNLVKMNPYDPSLQHFETIPTNLGTRILSDGLWGRIRHPNYLGDILLHLPLAAFVYSTTTVLAVVLIVSTLVYRSVLDERRCKHKYENAWDRYCNRVRYALVPRIY